jgi:hypothetical protein
MTHHFGRVSDLQACRNEVDDGTNLPDAFFSTNEDTRSDKDYGVWSGEVPNIGAVCLGRHQVRKLFHGRGALDSYNGVGSAFILQLRIILPIPVLVQTSRGDRLEEIFKMNDRYCYVLQF